MTGFFISAVSGSGLPSDYFQQEKNDGNNEQQVNNSACSIPKKADGPDQNQDDSDDVE